MREKASPTAMARSSSSPVAAPATSSSAISPKDTRRVHRKAEVRVFRLTRMLRSSWSSILSYRESWGDRLRSKELTPSRSSAPTKTPVERVKSRRHKDSARFTRPRATMPRPAQKFFL